MNTSVNLKSGINITLLCNPEYSTLQENITSINKTLACKDYNTTSKTNTKLSSSSKMKTFYMQPYVDRTTSFYGEYDPKIGIRTAAVLGTFLFLIIGYSVYKTKCKRDRWSSDDKQFIERYSKVLADKWSGKKPKVINRESTKRLGKPSLEETAKWIHSQPLQEVSLMNKWTLQDTMYNICLESLKATACPVCSLGDLSTNVNQSNSVLSPGSNASDNKITVDNLSSTFPTGLPLFHNSQCNNINIKPELSKHKSFDDNMHNSMVNTLHSLDNEFSNDQHLKLLQKHNKTDSAQNSTFKYSSDSNKTPFYLSNTVATESNTDFACHSGSDPSGDILSPITLETCSQGSSSNCSIIVHILTDNPDITKSNSDMEKKVNSNLIVPKDQSSDDQKCENESIAYKLHDNINTHTNNKYDIQDRYNFNNMTSNMTNSIVREVPNKKCDYEKDTAQIDTPNVSNEAQTEETIIQMTDMIDTQDNTNKESSFKC